MVILRWCVLPTPSKNSGAEGGNGNTGWAVCVDLLARSLCRVRLFPSVCYRLYGSLLPDSSVALVVATMTKPFQGPGQLQVQRFSGLLAAGGRRGREGDERRAYLTACHFPPYSY